MYLISDGGLSTNTLDTIESIMLTKNIDFIDGIKLDVRESLDNVFVLSKYNDLKKLTYSNKKVNEVNYHYLRKVKFPSHIFKYYIPTLEEVLINYNKNKIIVLEIYDSKHLDKLYTLLSKYNYEYYFMNSDKNVLDKFITSKLNNIGKIIDNNKIYIIKNVKYVKFYQNIFLIIEK